MKNTVIPALGAILLAIACTVEVEELEDASRLEAEAEAEPSAPVDERLIAPSGRTMVPAEIHALADSLVPAEVRNEPHFVHFESTGTTDEIEGFRVAYGPLELGADELHIGAPVAVTALEFDHHAGTATACHTGDCALGSRLADDDHGTTAWQPIDALTAAPDVANVVTWVVRFYTNTSYGGTMYSLSHDVTNTGLFVLGVPNAATVNGNDVWSSFRTYDAVCAACLVNGKEVDVYDVTVYRDANFVGPSKNFGGVDSDSNLATDVYSGGGSVDNSISSFKVSLAVYDPGPTCGNGSCGGGETYATCPQDCPPPCGDGVCQAGQTNATCPQDCPCGNGICGAGESYLNCPQDCTCGNGVCDFNETSFTCGVDCDSCIELGYGGQCSNQGPCCNSNSDCVGIGLVQCYMY